MELLLKAGADPNKKISGNDSDTVPLIIATMSNQKEMVRKLIKYGADVNIVDRNMYSAIHLAAWDGQTDIVRILLAEQASHDQKTIDLNTPVALACHGQYKLPPCIGMHALGLEFGSAAQLSKRPGSVWNCLWGNALKRSPGIIRKSRVSYPGPGFLSSATWPMLPKKHYNGLKSIVFSVLSQFFHFDMWYIW